jgi:hypothetical protein|tara:strand:+ start:208 stop:522 length:315 start_codon:yes stop_codon:yes gene_type:complete
VEKILENLWVLFIAIGSWMVTRLTAKIDNLEKDKADNSSVSKNSGLIHETDKRIDEIQYTTVPRHEYKSDIAGLHERVNSLERQKEDKVQDIRIVDSDEKKKGK